VDIALTWTQEVPLECFDTASVKLDSSGTPPPLHYSPTTSDLGPSSTADTTPIGTPLGISIPYLRRAEREKELLFSWHRKPIDTAAGQSRSYLDSTLLDPDFEDTTFPLFHQSESDPDMAGPSSPINIATQPRHNPNSPRQTQTSNLTSALQGAGGDVSRPALARVRSGTNGSNGFASMSGRHDSVSGGLSGMGFQWSSEARPIAMNNSNREKPRRESLAGSLVGGMSWGGVSVGSWIRDEWVFSITTLVGDVYRYPWIWWQLLALRRCAAQRQRAYTRQAVTDALQYNHGRHISFYVSVAFIPFVILPAEARGQFHERLLMLRHHSSLVARSSTALRRVSRAAGATDPSQNVPVEPTKSTTQQ